MIMAARKISADAKGYGGQMFGAPACPACKESLSSFSFTRPNFIERFGLTTRTIYGWCSCCNSGCEVEQYLVRGGLWLIYRWRKYNNRKKPKGGPWHIASDLPVPLVAVGTGNYSQLLPLNFSFKVEKFAEESGVKF